MFDLAIMIVYHIVIGITIFKIHEMYDLVVKVEKEQRRVRNVKRVKI